MNAYLYPHPFTAGVHVTGDSQPQGQAAGAQQLLVDVSFVSPRQVLVSCVADDAVTGSWLVLEGAGKAARVRLVPALGIVYIPMALAGERIQVSWVSGGATVAPGIDRASAILGVLGGM
mgnify:FL=1|jgi:hypothetical protein